MNLSRILYCVAAAVAMLLTGCATHPGVHSPTPAEVARAQIGLRCQCNEESGKWVLDYRIINLGKRPLFVYEQLPILWELHGFDASGKEIVFAAGGSTVYWSPFSPERYFLVRGSEEHVGASYTYLNREEKMTTGPVARLDPARSYIECRVHVYIRYDLSSNSENVDETCKISIPTSRPAASLPSAPQH